MSSLETTIIRYLSPAPGILWAVQVVLGQAASNSQSASACRRWPAPHTLAVGGLFELWAGFTLILSQGNIPFILVFYCCVKNDYNLSGLKQHIFFLNLSFRGSRIWAWLKKAPPLKSSQCCNQDVWWPASSLELGVLFQALVVLVGIQFWAAVGLRSLFSCWLSTGACSQLPEATCSSLLS